MDIFVFSGDPIESRNPPAYYTFCNPETSRKPKNVIRNDRSNQSLGCECFTVARPSAGEPGDFQLTRLLLRPFPKQVCEGFLETEAAFLG